MIVGNIVVHQVGCQAALQSVCNASVHAKQANFSSCREIFERNFEENYFCQDYLTEFHLTHLFLLDDSSCFLSVCESIGVYGFMHSALAQWLNLNGLAVSWINCNAHKNYIAVFMWCCVDLQFRQLKFRYHCTAQLIVSSPSSFSFPAITLHI